MRAMRVALGVAAGSAAMVPSFHNIPSFHNADRPTHRRVMAVGLLFCAAFVVISISLRPPPQDDRVLVKADRLVRTAGGVQKAN